MTTPTLSNGQDNEQQLIQPVHATLIASNDILTREQLALIPTPPSTKTHKPIPHHEVVQAVAETFGLRRIGLRNEQYAVSKDGMRMFGTMELDMGSHGVTYVAGLRNSHDKSMCLGLTAGYRVMVCENLAFNGDYTPVLRKHTKNVNLQDLLSVGIDNLLRNYEPMQRDIARFQETRLADVTAKLCIYEAFIEQRTDLPKHLMRPVHDLYFTPQHEEFQERNLWSLNNAFTSAIKVLDPVRQQIAAADIGQYFQQLKEAKTHG